jgi:hypothetical protein
VIHHGGSRNAKLSRPLSSGFHRRLRHRCRHGVACFPPRYRSANSWTVFHSACCESAFSPSQQCCFPWRFNTKAVSKFYFHCLHGVAMKPDRCHQSRWYTDSDQQPCLKLNCALQGDCTVTNPMLPTPVTCHSIGTPLAGTQILAEYREGPATFRPPCRQQCKRLAETDCDLLLEWGFR